MHLEGRKYTRSSWLFFSLSRLKLDRIEKVNAKYEWITKNTSWLDKFSRSMSARIDTHSFLYFSFDLKAHAEHKKCPFFQKKKIEGYWGRYNDGLTSFLTSISKEEPFLFYCQFLLSKNSRIWVKRNKRLRSWSSTQSSEKRVLVMVKLASSRSNDPRRVWATYHVANNPWRRKPGSTAVLLSLSVSHHHPLFSR